MSEHKLSTSTPMSRAVRAGVVGVGAMGENHARVYSELPGVTLAGISDHDADVAERVAEEYGTDSVPLETLLERCDVVTVAVPTPAHHEVVSRCLEADVHVLVEKPIAQTVEQGRELARTAHERGLVLQVGHIERFNPAVRTMADLIDDLEVISLEAERLGPPIDRTAPGNVVFDLMVHDVDIVGSLLGASPDSVAAMGTPDGRYATATMEYDDVVATLTASRVTQKKVRKLSVTARECFVEVDFLEQSVLIHRDSYPEYVNDEGQNRYRHESVVERPRIDNGEPLRHELESFVESVRSGTEPEVTPEDGIEALETVLAIDSLVDADRSSQDHERAQDPSQDREVEI
ncbi:oxidoreductase [Halobiforma lacisalsi AJ5]|uniref:Oxidoreductase n=1 Tax=Natronobacterium lacisalsi AJ5 TaxID=358396 RepID=M0LEJ0_NATLA|nr:Gfo/Idh/MocA family oxidoreductase [Halobiforma lacisalsi]APW99284.1 oxidoreductase [Halobiforma lacisalsi AJ5]EMA30859.1 oxidoreductase domain-containing protein [Halobiforma lacisalsi AJ5]